MTDKRILDGISLRNFGASNQYSAHFQVCRVYRNLFGTGCIFRSVEVTETSLVWSEFKMSYEVDIQNKIKAMGMSNDFLAALSGIPPTALSQAFRGVKDFTNEQCVVLTDLLRELKELNEAAAPLPLSFKNAKLIRAVLDQRKSGRLWIDVRIDRSIWDLEDTKEDNSTTVA
jgi:hypothetical protein